MAANSGFRLFSSSGDFANFGFGFASDSPQAAALHLPPPSVEVLPSEVPENVKDAVEPVNLGERTLLKLGSGHGLPAIFACLKVAPTVHLQDFNAEVLQCPTIPNMDANLKKSQAPECSLADRDIRFFGGDWKDVHQILPHVKDNEEVPNGDNGSASGGYDVILMAETMHSFSSLQNLYELVKKCMSRPHGAAYMAGKKHYFGVGGGTRRFLSLVEKDG